jgi:hypothetical protein
MPRPDDLPEWATGGSAVIDEPPTQKKQLGWEAFEKPSHGWFNYWWNLVYLWLAWLDENVVPVPEIGFLYRFGSPAEIVLDASPGAGGFQQIQGTVTFVGNTTPRHVKNTGGLGAANAARAVRELPQLTGNNLIAGSYITAVAIQMLYLRTNASDVAKLKLMRSARDGSGATAEVAAVTGDSTAGTFVSKSEVFTHAIDPDYVYWLEVEMEATAAADDVKIAFGKLTVQKTRVE